MRFAMQLADKICQTQSQLLSHVKFVLSWQAKEGHYERASSSLVVSRELHLILFPQGQSRPGLASQK
jgi:hypothetical protein